MCFLWLTKLHPVPKVDNKFFKVLLVVAAFHTVGHVAACTSFGQMAVSFAHIVKSAEPVFSVALAGPILKETYPIYVWLSLVPIVAGCGLSAMKEVSFAWNGFNNAMLSNVGMVLRNIYSKKALGDYKVFAISYPSADATCPCAVLLVHMSWCPAPFVVLISFCMLLHACVCPVKYSCAAYDHTRFAAFSLSLLTDFRHACSTLMESTCLV